MTRGVNNLSKQSLEERIKNWSVGQLEKIKALNPALDYGSENDIKNADVKQALENMPSKSGGAGTARPDANLMYHNIPVLIEYKWGVNKQRHDTKGTLDMRDKYVVNYADNGAVYYARNIVAAKKFDKAIAVGVAGELGNDIANPQVNVNVYLVMSDKEIIKPKHLFNAVSQHNFDFLLNPHFDDELTIDETDKNQMLKMALDVLKKRAKDLNKLMNNRSISVDQRVIYTSGMLLAMQNHYDEHGDLDLEGLTAKDLRGIKASSQSDGRKIYRQISDYLVRKSIPDDKVKMMMAAFAVINNDIDRDTKQPDTGMTINREIFEFIYDNIYTVIDSTSSLDVLGELYSEFLKYALGDGKENGIVLTPPYVTKLMNALINVDENSYVLDPATGSAGFLVSSMARMINNVKAQHLSATAEQQKIQDIRQAHMLGIELDMKMYTLATTNMILRGDGATNIVKGSAFTWDGNYEYDRNRGKFPANRLLINPPFSYAENGMPFMVMGMARLAIGGFGAIIIQDSAGSGKAEKSIATLLQTNQLLASIKMPGDLFQPNAGVQTSIYVMQHTGVEHDYKKTVKFIDFSNDGYKRTGRGTREIDHPHERYDDLLELYKYGKQADLKAKWNLDDCYVEDVIEKGNNKDWNYVSHRVIDTTPTEADFQKTIADYLSWKVSSKLEGRA